MCCKKQSSIRGGVLSPLPIKLAKITAILVVFCFAECAAGSCLSYGHACWGGHGKRNGGGAPPPPPNFAITPSQNRQFNPHRWFSSRLLQPPMDLSNSINPSSRQNFPQKIIHFNPYDANANSNLENNNLNIGRQLRQLELRQMLSPSGGALDNSDTSEIDSVLLKGSQDDFRNIPDSQMEDENTISLDDLYPAEQRSNPKLLDSHRKKRMILV